MSVADADRETCPTVPFGRHLAFLTSKEVLQKVAGLSDEDLADYQELLEEYRKTDSDEEKQETLQTMAEIVLDERAEGIPIEEIEREARSTLEGAAAVEKLGRQASTFAENLRRLRKRGKLSQAGLAGACDMTQPQISYLERGEHRPQELTVRKLAEALGVPAKELLPLE